MKKLLSMILAVAMVGTMSATAFAETASSTGKLDQRIDTLEERQEKIADRKAENEAKQAQLATKKEQYDAFRQDLLEKRQMVLGNREANITEISENNSLRLTLAQSLDAMQKSGATLSDDAAAQLKEYNSQVKEIAAAIEATKGQIKTITQQNKINIKNKDYAAMDAAYEQIASIQTWRLDQLKQINGLLQKMNTLVQAAAPGTSSGGADSAA